MSDAGDILGEKYLLVDQIGAGGMATIWRATNVALDRPVAVKFISSFSPNQRERFLNEAKVAASIRHRNVVDILDFGVTDGGEAYMVLEYLHGESLADRMARPPAMNLGEIVNVAVLTLSGLSAVHTAGVVHRDIKPENVFLVEDEDGWYPKLLDFGVSKQQQTEGSIARPLTQEGMLVGTPQYMAPEQARGLRDVDARADLWSTGVMMYELLTGDLPFDSENVGDVLLAVMSKEILPVVEVRPEVGPELSAVVGKAMQRDRTKRYQNAKEMRQAILEAAAQLGDAAGMWGRITPGQGGTHEEHATPISGLIQIATLEAVRASKASIDRSVDRSKIRSDEITSEAVFDRAGKPTPPPADPLAATIAGTTPVVAGLKPRDAATPIPAVAESGLVPRKSGGAGWFFALVAVLGLGAGGLYVWKPEFFAGLLGASPVVPDGGIADDMDGGTLDGADFDGDVENLAAAPDLGPTEVDAGGTHGSDAGAVDSGAIDAGEDGADDAGDEEGVEEEDAGKAKRHWHPKRWVKRHKVGRPGVR